MILKVGVILFVAEVVISYIFPLLDLPGGIWENVANGLVLAVLVVPALYAAGFRVHKVVETHEQRHRARTRIERRAVVLLAVLVGTVAVFVASTVLLAPKIETGFAVINAAGRQRMLSQRLVKDAMASVSSPTQPAHGMTDSAASVTDRIAQFERVLRGLVDGDSELGLVPCPSPDVIRGLEAVTAAWKPFRERLTEIPKPKGDDAIALYRSRLDEAGNRLLAEMERTVSALETHYETQAAFLRTLQGWLLIGVLAAGGLLVVTFVQSSRQRRRLDADLADSEARTRTIVETAADGIITIDERGVIETFNLAAERIFGYLASEVVGKNIKGLMPSPYCDEHDAYLLRYMEGGEPRVIGIRREVPGRRKDGSTFPAELHTSESRLGTRRVFTGIVTDITERKRTEKQLKDRTDAFKAANIALEVREQQMLAQQRDLQSANEALEKASRRAETSNQAKSAFLANMSHEIRTPMTAILGFAETLLNPNQLEPERRDAVRTIRRNGEHLLDIINDILDISKVEAGKMTTESRTCSPIRLIADVISLMRVRAQSKDLVLNAEYLGPIPETIRTDATRLRQILINLLGNAIKFTGEGGVRLLTRHVRTDDGESLLQFDVIDTGIGMTDDQISRIFDVFTQADTSHTRKFGGTGLGLALSKRLAQMLGGDIAVVETQLGVGTRFRATVRTGPTDGIPTIEPTAAAMLGDLPDRNPDASEPRLDGRILLAEDCLDNQMLISMILRAGGAEVEIVGNGLEAVEKVQATMLGRREGDPKHSFDLILMDMQMPVMDGYEATAALRAKGYAGPVIALTANAMAGDRKKCLDVGCTDYATKPISKRKLLETIARHLEPVPVPA